MTLPLVIIANCNAGHRNKRANVLARLRAALGPNEQLLITTDQAELDAAARRMMEQQVRRVALLGGDGTLTASLTALRAASGSGQLPAELVLLRGGTMNTVANNLGASRGTAGQLLRRSRSLPTGTGRPVRPLIVNGRVGFLLSTGLMHRFLAEYYALKPRPNARSAAGLLARGSLSALHGGALARRLATRYRATLEVNGEPIAEREYLFIGAGAVPQVGLGFRPYGRTASNPDGFHVIGYSGSIGTLALHLPAFARGRGERVPDTLDLLAQHLSIVAAPAHPLPFALDGEMFASVTELHVEVGPQIRIV